MSSDIFFEVVREKRHIFLDGNAGTRIDDIKATVAELSNLSPNDFKLLWRKETATPDAPPTWVELESGKTLGDAGITRENSSAQTPAFVGILFEGEQEPAIAELSTPPELPEAMRNADGAA